MTDKEVALKASLKKSADRIERDEARALKDNRDIQIQDYDAGAKILKQLERAMRAEKQAVLDGYKPGETP